MRELLNVTLLDRWERRFRALPVDAQAAEIAALTDSLDFNGPSPIVAAKFAVIDLA